MQASEYKAGGRATGNCGRSYIAATDRHGSQDNVPYARWYAGCGNEGGPPRRPRSPSVPETIGVQARRDQMSIGDFY